VAGCDRLVLLGDVVELRHGPARDALAAAREPLTRIGAALGPERDVMIVPGNHDHALLGAWLERRARGGPPPPLGLGVPVDHEPGDMLATIAGWLSPAHVQVGYPGVWLRDDVYATHGHYADLHLTIPTVERLAAGVMGRIVAVTEAGGPGGAEDYERVLAPMYAWIHAIAQRVDPRRGGALHAGSVRGWVALTGPRGGLGLRRRAVAVAYPAVIAGLNRAKIGPLRAELSGAALRQAGLRGAEEATRRLGVRAAYIAFGHTHRAGPLPDDDFSEWRTEGGAQLVNCGCWVSEPRFTRPASRPYQVGWCVWVGDEGPPQVVNLLG
jgi:hypothetical protein